MRKIIFVLCLSSLIIACNQSEDFSNETLDGLSGLPADAEKTPYSDNPNLIKVSYTNVDGTSEAGDFLNGKKTGNWTKYHRNGLVKSVTSYVNGLKQGAHIELNEQGQLELKSYYHNNELDGKWVKYNRNRIKEERPYVNGQLNGIVKIYYDNGNTMEESPYVDGKRHGEAIWYDQNGVETIRYTYENGTLVEK